MQQRVGELVVAAFGKKEQANSVEAEAIARLETGVKRKVIHVGQWG
jgi:hypothetical protein